MSASLVLAGGSAYWLDLHSTAETAYSTLESASPGRRRAADLGFAQSIDKWGSAGLVPVASDGSNAYAVLSPDDGTPGPIFRWTGYGRGEGAVTGTIPAVEALAGGGRRFAYASAAGRTLDCAADPSWSPDGREIAFSRTSLLADAGSCPGGIWLVNSSGGRARRILADGQHPDWSPDGTKIAVGDSHGHVVVANADGSDPHTVAKGNNPAWSPDGSRLAYDRGGNLYIANADGSGEHQLAAGATNPDWSPDGNQLVFEQVSSPTGELGLRIIGSDGTGERSLTTNSVADFPDFNDANPSWSPDGRLIVYSSGLFDVSLIAPDGTGRRDLLASSSSGRSFGAPAWAPDSQRVVVAYSDDTTDAGDPHLIVSGLVGSSWKTLTATPVPASQLFLGSPTGGVHGHVNAHGSVLGLAVSADTFAAVEKTGGRTQVEIFRPRHRIVPLPRTPGPDQDVLAQPLTASGTTLVYHLGRTIYALHARHGQPVLVAHAAADPIGLSVVGRRIAWAENNRHGARVEAITLP